MGHDLADQSACLVAAAIDDDYVAATDHFKGAVNGEIVARTRAHRESRADHPAAAMERS